MIRLPHLETNVTIACQLRCVGCNHFVAPQVYRFKESMIAPVVLERDLRNFGRVAHADAWAAIGGEPTLHPKLPVLLQIAAESGVADVIEVWTNGIEIREQPADFWRWLSRLVVSVYPEKLTDDDLAWIAAKCGGEAVELVIKDERRHPNFTRLLEPEPTDDGATQRKWHACWFKTYSRVLDNGWFYRCCTSPFIARVLYGMPEGTDALRVNESLTEADLHRFLGQQRFMESCRPCAGRNTESAVPLPWREVRDPAEWLRASAGIAS